MSRELYSALSGAGAAWAQVELVSNNLANSSTPGYKAGKMAFTLEGTGRQHLLADSFAEPTEVHHDRRDGAVELDGDPLHVALQGRGFFAVQAGGEQMLTRDGRFSLNLEGQLVTAGGMPVLGEGGPLTVPPGEQLRIDATGVVYGSVSGELGKLQIVDADARPVDNNLWRPDGPIRPADAQVVQGGLEGSNVDPMRELVHLIEAGRAFDTFEKAMQTSDELDERLHRLGSP